MVSNRSKRRVKRVYITMKVTIVALLLLSCIMSAQMTLTTYGWGYTPFGYPKLRQEVPQPLLTPIQPIAMPLQMNAFQERAFVTDDELNAVKQISDGSEKFSFEFFRVRIFKL